MYGAVLKYGSYRLLSQTGPLQYFVNVSPKSSLIAKPIDNLYEKAWRIINGYEWRVVRYRWRIVKSYSGKLALLLVAGDLIKAYEKIRPANEPRMTAKEIADLALENVRRQRESADIVVGA